MEKTSLQYERRDISGWKYKSWGERRIHNRRIGSREIAIVVVECVISNDIWLSSPSAATGYSRKSIIRGDKPSPLQRYRVDNLFKLKQLHRTDRKVSPCNLSTSAKWISRKVVDISAESADCELFPFAALTRQTQRKKCIVIYNFIYQ